MQQTWLSLNHKAGKHKLRKDPYEWLSQTHTYVTYSRKLALMHE